MLESELIRLRALEPGDLDILYKWENNVDVWEVSGTVNPFSKHTLEQYISNSHQDIYTNRQLRLIIESRENSKIVGCIDIFDFDPLNKRAGIGILIAEKDDRKKGYAKESIRLVIHYGFTLLHLHQFYANVLEDNKGSIALFSSFGFIESGKKADWIYSAGKWKTEYLLQLIKPADNS